MADNKDKSRADDLFEILNAVHNETDGDESNNSDDTGSRIDEILGMLSSNDEDAANEAAVSEEPEEPEIPTSIFGHLSEEGDVETETPYAGNPHFTEEIDVVPSEDDNDHGNADEDEDDEVGIRRKFQAQIRRQILPRHELYPKSCNLYRIGGYSGGVSFLLHHHYRQ